MGKRILIATRTPKGLPGGSGFHLRNMIEVLEKSGYEVDIHRPLRGDYDAPLKDDDYLIGWEFKPDVVIADYSWMCTAFSCFKDVLKICFVHDLRCRIIPCLEAIGYKDTQGWTEEKEAELLRKADILLVLNDEDAAFCRRMAPDCKIVRIGIAMEPVEHDPTKEITGRCIYVGSDNLENRHAMRWFKEYVEPLVKKQMPHVTLQICVGTDNLEQAYSEAQLAVVPHIMKGGLKIKTAEAFAHGLFPLGNKCAFDGFEKFINFKDEMDAPEHIAEAIIHNLKYEDREEVSAKAHAVCKAMMTPQVAYGELLKVLV